MVYTERQALDSQALAITENSKPAGAFRLPRVYKVWD